MKTRQEAQQCKKGRIELALCDNCGIVWNIAFDPQLLEYSAPYEATQMLSPAFYKYAEDVAKLLIKRYDLHAKEIVDIGCGDGYFLKMLCRLGNNHGIGFDPSWQIENDRNLPENVKIIRDYYSDRYATYEADLICCRHVLEHIHEPIVFLQNLAHLNHGRHPVFFFEVPDLSWSLRELAFWDIFYEHYLYFSRASLRYLLELCSFDVLEVQEGFGQQYIWIESLFKPEKTGDRLKIDLSREVDGLARDIKAFSVGYQRMVEEFQSKISSLAKHGRVVVWGAGGKAAAFLNLLCISIDQIEFVVDINPKKWGAYVPGTGQEIVSPHRLMQHKPDIILVMNPEYLSEVGEMVKQMGIPAELLAIGKNRGASS